MGWFAVRTRLRVCRWGTPCPVLLAGVGRPWWRSTA